MFVLFLLGVLACSANELHSSLRTDNDVYGTRFVGNDFFLVYAQNDYLRYQFHFQPFGEAYFCVGEYSSEEIFVLNVAIGYRQNVTDLFFVYLRTTQNFADQLQLGILRINQTGCLEGDARGSQNDTVVHRFNQSDYEISVLTVDFDGKYAFGFLLHFAYILDIARGNVLTFPWKEILPNITQFFPRDAETSLTSDGVPLVLLVGYFAVDFDSTLPAVHLLRFEAPSRLVHLGNLTLIRDLKVPGSFAFKYNFNYVMSISIQHQTRQALIALPSYGQTFLIQFNSQRITLLNRTFRRAARSVAWLREDNQAAFVLANTPASPWALSQVQVINASMENTDLATLYALPNNQQTLTFLTPTQTTSFIRLKVSGGQPVILTSDSSLIYAPISPAGSFSPVIEISANVSQSQSCPAGTFKSQSGPGPCLICPTGYRTSTRGVRRARERNQYD